MGTIAHPETFVALRARHEAFRIATDVMRGQGVDVEHFTCHACGGEIDWNRSNDATAMDCPACGAINELPCHLRYRVTPPQTDACNLDYESLTYQRAPWWEECPMTTLMSAPIPNDPTPFWLRAFCLACLGVVLAAFAILAIASR